MVTLLVVCLVLALIFWVFFLGSARVATIQDTQYTGGTASGNKRFDNIDSSIKSEIFMYYGLAVLFFFLSIVSAGVSLWALLLLIF